MPLYAGRVKCIFIDPPYNTKSAFEYYDDKGAHLYDAPDSREKRDIGAVWAQASGGRCCFVMVTSPEKAGRSVSAQLASAL
jgi:hypothetical protein